MERTARGFAIAQALLCGLIWAIAAAAVAGGPLRAQTGQNVMIVVNDNSPLSREIGEYYARRRAVPAKNICHIQASVEELIHRPDFNQDVQTPVMHCLQAGGLTESILYIVTTKGVPLKIPGGDGLGGDAASVDSELTLLYSDIMHGPHSLPGSIPNPFFGEKTAKFTHPQFPMYMVTRLAAYDFEGVKAIIDRALIAANRGKFVIDLAGDGNTQGETWLKEAARLLPKDRVVLDETTTVLTKQTDVIGYASWGSNDKARHDRFLGFQWLPGAIMTEFVSTNARTFNRPPAGWNISSWTTPAQWFAGAPQTLTADYLLEGATGASGHVDEPYLIMTPRPELVLPAYYSGRNLAESFYMGIPRLSWENIVVGDPLCSLGKP